MCPHSLPDKKKKKKDQRSAPSLLSPCWLTHSQSVGSISDGLVMEPNPNCVS